MGFTHLHLRGTMSSWNQFLAEFLGTFLLVLTVAVNVGAHYTDTFFAILSIASALMIAVYVFAHVSGGHLNPAVSLGVFICKPEFGILELIGYVLSQMAGGFCAALVYRAFYDNVIAVYPVGDTKAWAACVAEGLYTAFLVFNVLNCALPKRSEGNEFYGLCIGFSIVAAGFSIGGISGAYLNPAVAIPLGLTTSHLHDSSNDKGYWWPFIYMAVELFAACVAAGAYKIVRWMDQHIHEPATIYSKLTAELKKNLANKIFGYLARCEF